MNYVLARVVRYFHGKKQDVIDAVLDAVEIESGTAENFYSAVKNLLMDKNNPLGNIGFGSDKYSTIIGIKSWF